MLADLPTSDLSLILYTVGVVLAVVGVALHLDPDQ